LAVIGADSATANKYNKVIGHEHIWFDDGSNRGFGDGGEFDEPVSRRKEYKCSDKTYDEDKMRQAIKYVEENRTFNYHFFSTNCQLWTEQVRNEYERLQWIDNFNKKIKIWVEQ
jgi:hypothetical protein